MKKLSVRIGTISKILVSLILFFPIFSYSQEEAQIEILKDLNIVNGPDEISLGQIAKIKLPENYVYLNGSDTRIFLERLQNPPTNQEVGLIADKEFAWFVVFEFSSIGYVNDDEKDELDAEEILESMIDANEEANKIREKNGWGKLTITGWETQPRYNQVTNNLEWAINGIDDAGFQVINHSTRLLGRRGVMELTLVVDPQSYRRVKNYYAELINTFSFQTGQKYTEFTEGDKVAEYGLTALVLGGGTAIAAKTGLLKYLWKILIFVFVGIAGFFKKIFRRFSKKKID